MRYESSLLGGAAVGVALALCFGATAEAKTVKHRHHAAAAPKPDLKEEEIQELKSENAALNQRISALESAQASTQAAAQQAQATAQQTAAAQQAQADQIKRIPGEVQTAVVAKIPKPVTGWWNNTSVSGRMYYNLSNIDLKYDGVKPAGSPNGVGFDIKRFYLTVDHKFNDTFSAQLTTDFNYDSGPAGATQLYIKKAFLQAKLANALTLRLGSADLPWVPFVEDVYGLRYIENVLPDRTKFGTSADWGVHALGTLPMGDKVKISYALAVINGMGYKKPGFIAGVNRSKDMDFEGRVSANVGDFVAAVGGYDGKLGKDVQGVTTYHTANRFDALLAYQGKRFRIGGEYLYAKDWNDVTLAPPGIPNATYGWSGFGSFKFNDQFMLFGRYDWVKPKHTTAPSLKNDYFNVGLQYEPVKIVDFSLVYKRDNIDNGAFSDQNFSTVNTTVHGTYDEIGLWGQFRW
jgi:hypothetical protein